MDDMRYEGFNCIGTLVHAYAFAVPRPMSAGKAMRAQAIPDMDKVPRLMGHLLTVREQWQQRCCCMQALPCSTMRKTLRRVLHSPRPMASPQRGSVTVALSLGLTPKLLTLILPHGTHPAQVIHRKIIMVWKIVGKLLGYVL